MKISEIFKNKGEKFFRILEEREVLESLKKSKCVIALGGGAFMKKTVRDRILKDSVSIWLDVNLKTLNKRAKWNKKRPLINEEDSQMKINKFSSECPFQLLYVSTIEPYKHHYQVIDAVAKVRAEGFPVVLKLIGGAKPTDANRLKKKIQNIDPVGQFVHYLGFNTHEELLLEYCKADVCRIDYGKHISMQT